MVDAEYRTIGTMAKDGAYIKDLPKELLDSIYEAAYSLDLKEVDQDIKEEKYYLYKTDVDHIYAVVGPTKIIIIIRMGYYDEDGKQGEDKIFKMGIGRDEQGNIIDIRKVGELNV